MQIKENDIVKVFYDVRDKMLHYAFRGINTKIGLDEVEMERLVDEVLINTVSTKRVFSTAKHLESYFFTAFKCNSRRRFFVLMSKFKNSNKMTDQQRMEQFKLAREIMENGRQKVKN